MCSRSHSRNVGRDSNGTSCGWRCVWDCTTPRPDISADRFTRKATGRKHWIPQAGVLASPYPQGMSPGGPPPQARLRSRGLQGKHPQDLCTGGHPTPRLAVTFAWQQLSRPPAAGAPPPVPTHHEQRFRNAGVENVTPSHGLFQWPGSHASVGNSRLVSWGPGFAAGHWFPASPGMLRLWGWGSISQPRPAAPHRLRGAGLLGDGPLGMEASLSQSQPLRSRAPSSPLQPGPRSAPPALPAPPARRDPAAVISVGGPGGAGGRPSPHRAAIGRSR